MALLGVRLPWLCLAVPVCFVCGGCAMQDASAVDPAPLIMSHERYQQWADDQNTRVKKLSKLYARGVIEIRWEDETGRHFEQGDLQCWFDIPDRSEFEDTGLAAIIGFETQKRLLAAKLDVDPYSSNKVLQKQLNRFAWAAYAGSLPSMFVPFIPTESTTRSSDDRISEILRE